jgi:hypothetical protein
MNRKYPLFVAIFGNLVAIIANQLQLLQINELLQLLLTGTRKLTERAGVWS